MNSDPDRWDEWFSETHGGTEECEIESDVDDICTDYSYDDPPSR